MDRGLFDQLEEVVNAVGDKIDVICEGGIRRASYIKSFILRGKACSGGRMYLYALAAGGQKGLRKPQSKKEIERDMILMGVSNVSELSKKTSDLDPVK